MTRPRNQSSEEALQEAKELQERLRKADKEDSFLFAWQLAELATIEKEIFSWDVFSKAEQWIKDTLNEVFGPILQGWTPKGSFDIAPGRTGPAEIIPPEVNLGDYGILKFIRIETGWRGYLEAGIIQSSIEINFLKEDKQIDSFLIKKPGQWSKTMSDELVESTDRILVIQK